MKTKEQKVIVPPKIDCMIYGVPAIIWEDQFEDPRIKAYLKMKAELRS